MVSSMKLRIIITLEFTVLYAYNKERVTQTKMLLTEGSINAINVIQLTGAKFRKSCCETDENATDNSSLESYGGRLPGSQFETDVL